MDLIAIYLEQNQMFDITKVGNGVWILPGEICIAHSRDIQWDIQPPVQFDSMYGEEPLIYYNEHQTAVGTIINIRPSIIRNINTRTKYKVVVNENDMCIEFNDVCFTTVESMIGTNEDTYRIQFTARNIKVHKKFDY